MHINSLTVKHKTKKFQSWKLVGCWSWLDVFWCACVSLFSADRSPAELSELNLRFSFFCSHWYLNTRSDTETGLEEEAWGDAGALLLILLLTLWGSSRERVEVIRHPCDPFLFPHMFVFIFTFSLILLTAASEKHLMLFPAVSCSFRRPQFTLLCDRNTKLWNNVLLLRHRRSTLRQPAFLFSFSYCFF